LISLEHRFARHGFPAITTVYGYPHCTVGPVPAERPGYGSRHPALVDLLATLTPVATDRVQWPGHLVDVAAYLTPSPPLPDLVVSVRCIVGVDGRVVVCETPNDTHVMPGGRREPGETFEATARREVHEETGWLVDEPDLRLLGFLHFRFVTAVPDDHPYPHPDFLQLVYTAPARAHAGGRPAEWADTAGWERTHRLLTPGELAGVDLPAVQRAFLAAAGFTS
jgi:8-oxo-dGTP pyrophosphatase MutT (NUDIX family)